MLHFLFAMSVTKPRAFHMLIDKCSTTELHLQTSVFWNRVPLHNSGLPSTLYSCEFTIPSPRLLHSRVAALCHHILTRLVSLKYKEETPRGLGRWLGERNALCKKSLSLDALNAGENWTWWYKPVTAQKTNRSQELNGRPGELLVQWEKKEKSSRRATAVLSASGKASDTH